MSIRRPSGYCGANIVRFQSGSTSVTARRPPATTSSARGPKSSLASRCRFSVSSRLRIGPPRLLPLHDQVALHLLVERRAEVRAVEGEDACLVGLERDG